MRPPSVLFPAVPPLVSLMSNFLAFDALRRKNMGHDALLTEDLAVDSFLAGSSSFLLFKVNLENICFYFLFFIFCFLFRSVVLCWRGGRAVSGRW